MFLEEELEGEDGQNGDTEGKLLVVVLGYTCDCICLMLYISLCQR